MYLSVFPFYNVIQKYIVKTFYYRYIPRRRPGHAGAVFPPADYAAALEPGGDVEVLFTDEDRCAGRNFHETGGSGGRYQHDEKSEKKIFFLHESNFKTLMIKIMTFIKKSGKPDSTEGCRDPAGMYPDRLKNPATGRESHG